MNKLNSELPQLPEPNNPILSKRHLLGFVFLLVVFGTLIFLIYDWQTKKLVQQNNNSEVCAQVITFAKNPESGEIRQFSTSCDVPKGWKEVKPESATSTLDTSKWKMYANDDYGIEFKIPDGWGINYEFINNQPVIRIWHGGISQLVIAPEGNTDFKAPEDKSENKVAIIGNRQFNVNQWSSLKFERYYFAEDFENWVECGLKNLEQCSKIDIKAQSEQELEMFRAVLPTIRFFKSQRLTTDKPVVYYASDAIKIYNPLSRKLLSKRAPKIDYVIESASLGNGKYLISGTVDNSHKLYKYDANSEVWQTYATRYEAEGKVFEFKKFLINPEKTQILASYFFGTEEGVNHCEVTCSDVQTKFSFLDANTGVVTKSLEKKLQITPYVWNADVIISSYYTYEGPSKFIVMDETGTILADNISEEGVVSKDNELFLYYDTSDDAKAVVDLGVGASSKLMSMDTNTLKNSVFLDSKKEILYKIIEMRKDGVVIGEFKSEDDLREGIGEEYLYDLNTKQKTPIFESIYVKSQGYIRQDQTNAVWVNYLENGQTSVLRVNNQFVDAAKNIFIIDQ